MRILLHSRSTSALIDYFGNEVLKGDSVVLDPSNGEMILEDSLEDYLIEVKGFQFSRLIGGRIIDSKRFG